jgi:uncharacterized protein
MYLLQPISLQSEFINVINHFDVCCDPKDNFLLSLSLEGKANHLITGDKDLLDLHKYGETTMLTIAKYLSNK